ncbi:MAG: rRNA maturation RNase YbeY [Aphanocapsa sp. GSE-SYN-MK-11-07L]|jgi:probable rRNA maturation factor|nr:rRNA maturation RNase YbeY [Aphanocapsa sp. GSE-SYN-MK-11-07L]
MSNPNLQVEVTLQDHYTSQPGHQLLARDADLLMVEIWQTWFQTWLETLQPTLSPCQHYELSLRLADNAEIRRLNHHYRQADQPTDVLAFASLEIDAPQSEVWLDLPLYLGDIVISVETASGQAAQHGHDLRTELAWLAAHGFLHLLGWDHPDSERLQQMLDQQMLLLGRIGLISPASLDLINSLT